MKFTENVLSATTVIYVEFFIIVNIKSMVPESVNIEHIT